MIERGGVFVAHSTRHLIEARRPAHWALWSGLRTGIRRSAAPRPVRFQSATGPSRRPARPRSADEGVPVLIAILVILGLIVLVFVRSGPSGSTTA
ncbi:MAG: hypothetical protein U0Q10_06465 [Dermatophilaceae bacterium]